MPIYGEDDKLSKSGESGVMKWVQGGVCFLVFLLVAILVIIVLLLLGPVIGNVFSDSQMMGAI
jgi:hypothetical protein